MNGWMEGKRKDFVLGVRMDNRESLYYGLITLLLKILCKDMLQEICVVATRPPRESGLGSEGRVHIQLAGVVNRVFLWTQRR